MTRDSGVTSHERVLTACAFRRPDRIPRFDNFWKYPDSWRALLGDPADLTDVKIWVPDETTFPSRARFIKREAGSEYRVDGWGRTIRRRDDAYFCETLEVPIPAGADIDVIEFEPPDLDSRFLKGGDIDTVGCRSAGVENRLLDGNPEAAMTERLLREAKERYCVFGKTGGPFLRSCFVRGEEQFLMDIAGDPPLARAIADKVGDHLTAVGVEEIRRWSLQETGIIIYDDMGSNDGPMFRPESFEKVFLPAYRRMIKAYKNAGAKYVLLHSDGDINVVLDMLVDAGIDGLNPIERRAHMDVVALRKKYPRLILTGAMDNTDTLVNGPAERIEAEAREIIDLGRDGGVIIGTHSISPEIPLEHFLAYHETCLSYGRFSE